MSDLFVDIDSDPRSLQATRIVQLQKLVTHYIGPNDFSVAYEGITYSDDKIPELLAALYFEKFDDVASTDAIGDALLTLRGLIRCTGVGDQ